ncbi:hypothetical protein ACHAW6_011604 [Cyclotella cf. meneghiniana]
MKATWLKEIRTRNYARWQMIMEKNVNKFFPKLDETQKGHMRQTKQVQADNSGQYFDLPTGAARHALMEYGRKIDTDRQGPFLWQF